MIGQEKAPGSTHSTDSQSGEGKTEGLIFTNPNGNGDPLILQSQNVLEVVLDLLQCVVEDHTDHRAKNAKIGLVMDFIQFQLDDRPYAVSGRDLDDIPY